MRTASRPPPEYRSYILRLRRTEGEEARTQFILIDFREGRRFCFANPDALISFLAGGPGARVRLASTSQVLTLNSLDKL